MNRAGRRRRAGRSNCSLAWKGTPCRLTRRGPQGAMHCCARAAFERLLEVVTIVLMVS